MGSSLYRKIDKIRIYLAIKMLGNLKLIHNVKFYQTVSLDADSSLVLNRVSVEFGHDIKWKTKSHGISFSFEHYEKRIQEINGDN